MKSAVDCPKPLTGIIVIDAVNGPLASMTRYLAELGAEVFRVPPRDCADEIADLAANLGKRFFDLDLAGDHITAAHVIVADYKSQIDLPYARAERPALVTMTVSDFGTDTACSLWSATDPVLHALSGELSRSGIRGRPPLLPPGDLAYQCAASQGAFALASALYRALRRASARVRPPRNNAMLQPLVKSA